LKFTVEEKSISSSDEKLATAEFFSATSRNISAISVSCLRGAQQIL
jgi:hypothetical protein